MPIIVELGSIVAGAESYVTVAEYVEYHAKRGITITGADVELEADLRKGWVYLDGNYRQRFKGIKTSQSIQNTEWPRIGCVLVDDFLSWEMGQGLGYGGPLCIPSNIIPQRIKDAQCELSYRSRSGPLAVDGETNITRKKVDVLETEFMAGTVRGQKQYQIVDQLLSDLVRPVGSATALRG